MPTDQVFDRDIAQIRQPLLVAEDLGERRHDLDPDADGCRGILHPTHQLGIRSRNRDDDHLRVRARHHPLQIGQLSEHPHITHLGVLEDGIVIEHPHDAERRRRIAGQRADEL